MLLSANSIALKLRKLAGLMAVARPEDAAEITSIANELRNAANPAPLPPLSELKKKRRKPRKDD
jgi:hypothetical protein